jgi:hypothetical protein
MRACSRKAPQAGGDRAGQTVSDLARDLVAYSALPCHDESMLWAMETVPNPSVLRLHTTEELTDRTILTCPPGTPTAPLDRLLALPEVRSLNLHRYRCRVNVRPGANAIAVGNAVERNLLTAWGTPEPLPPEEEPKAFVIRREGPMVVAESYEMAAGDSVALALFAVQGVVEVVSGKGMVLVRIGRLFRWSAVQSDVVRALTRAMRPPTSS